MRQKYVCNVHSHTYTQATCRITIVRGSVSRQNVEISLASFRVFLRILFFLILFRIPTRKVNAIPSHTLVIASFRGRCDDERVSKNVFSACSPVVHDRGSRRSSLCNDFRVILLLPKLRFKFTKYYLNIHLSWVTMRHHRRWYRVVCLHNWKQQGAMVIQLHTFIHLVTGNKRKKRNRKRICCVRNK